jgi:hypothetical protein
MQVLRLLAALDVAGAGFDARNPRPASRELLDRVRKVFPP